MTIKPANQYSRDDHSAPTSGDGTRAPVGDYSRMQVMSVGPAVPPIRLRFGTRLVEAWCGLWDRAVCRVIPDGEMTHHLLQVEAATRRREVEQINRTDQLIADRRIEIAVLESVLAESAPADPPGRTDDPGTLPARERERWASDQRRHAAAVAESAHRSNRRRNAVENLGRLHAELIELLACKDTLHRSFEAHFTARAAIYTRFRTGWFGLKPTGASHVPPYRSVIQGFVKEAS